MGAGCAADGVYNAGNGADCGTSRMANPVATMWQPCGNHVETVVKTALDTVMKAVIKADIKAVVKTVVQHLRQAT